MTEEAFDLRRRLSRIDSAETVEPTELGDEALGSVSGGVFPEYDPDG